MPRLFVVGAVTVLVAAGCGAASHQHSTTGPRGKFPIVVAHPAVQSTGFPHPELRRLRLHGAVLLSPSQVAFWTSGSATCAWWPTRLTVLGPTAIRIDMRVNGRIAGCGSGAVGFPIAVTLDPRAVDVHRPVTVRLAYNVRPPGEATRQWSRSFVASAISRS